MKSLLYLSLLPICLSILGCAAKELPTSITIDKQKLLLLCSHETTALELKAIAIQIQAIHNMQLDYSRSIFDDEGQIRKLQLDLLYNNQKLASTKAQLLNLQYRYYGIEFTRAGDEITTLRAGVFE